MKPRATYRLQLQAGFGFAAAADAIPYLVELGISHLYLSPVMQAAPGSTHGYDVVDPARVSEDLGGEAGFRALVQATQAAGLGILLDIVPNHMSIAGTANRYWLDVLENGPASYYAHFFDVDWGAGGDDRVLLPILGDRYGRALTNGVLGLAWNADGFAVRAHDHLLPVSPRSLGPSVRNAGEQAGHAELAFLGDALCSLPSSRETELERRRRRHRDKAVLMARLFALCREEPACKTALERELAAINSDPIALDAVLEHQNYRLAHWTVAGSQLSYRRFFDITTLVGIRNEDPDVLEGTHERVFAWLRDGTIDGVRIDHVDGLRQPAGYLARLREVAPDAWLVVEKILAPGEVLPASWPIDGTSGYDFMERVDALFVDAAAEASMTATFEAYTGEVFDPPAASRTARLEVMSDALHSELARLTELAVRACSTTPACRDYTWAELEITLGAILAGYPTYRTYLGEGPGTDTGDDRERIAGAVAAAAAARPELDRDLLAYLEAALAFEIPTPEGLDLARTAQQITGPIVAKGDEDTLLYRQVRLLARCEVGSDVAAFAVHADEIHRQLATGSRRSLLATSTHDTKRSEDVRARIAAISEHAGAWESVVLRWRERAAAGWGETVPDRVLEYATWQTLVGAWPLPVERARTWAEKATREARLRTSWRRPDTAYEAARDGWLDHVYGDTELVAEVAAFAERLRPAGDRNALAMLLVKLTAPGVPDFYQGTELRDDSLVDPDNRRPVDLGLRRSRLRELAERPADRPPADDLGAAKLWTIRRVLDLRRREPARFDGEKPGDYEPLVATGPHGHRVFAFARGLGELRTLTVVPRLGPGPDGWRDTALTIPDGTWRDVLSDRRVAGGAVTVAELWRSFAIALLVRD
ncbi:MAG: malto-oligosyltrehalose synthase [Deltaproteobacteria bacterium]|nr:malto-oligosyltrehalose synthase [Deltaproteobacteria bacterium]MDQ3300241.1 malto-oligosyltrehalose synthase [Myxococcota bacterium]